MKIKEISFQQKAINELRVNVSDACEEYQKRRRPQVVSYTAPTGAGKTIVMTSLIERIFCGDENYLAQPDAVFVWLSDSPELNKQSRDKIEAKADSVQMRNTVMIEEDSFSQEELYDGYIYFLNTQKLSRSSNLTKHSDKRQWTIWETLANTVMRKGSRLYVIIDEAHRGMREGQQMAHATTIMQKFLKGSEEDHLPKMPVVIGMTATSARFNNLVANIGTTTIRQVTSTAEEVRSSGLLKDRIILEYPDAANMDMAVLQAAADDWKDKVLRWEQYCREQHHAYVNPVMVIQVQNGTGTAITQTDLNDCLRKIEQRTGWKLKEWEVVHTFGQTSADIEVNGMNVHYMEPSRIQDDRKIKIVFFKENLSTGWDCPRAETMMSFRRAQDATYIAQLLGRMVRTPLGMRISVDETLNDVRLFLPYFDTQTVKDVISALQSDDANSVLKGSVYGESVGQRKIVTLSATPRTKEQDTYDSATKTQGGHLAPQTEGDTPTEQPKGYTATQNSGTTTIPTSVNEQTIARKTPELWQTEDSQQPSAHNVIQTPEEAPKREEPQDDGIDRLAIISAINDMGLLTYDVRSTRTYDYLRSLFSLSRFLTAYRIDNAAQGSVRNKIVEKISTYVSSLKKEGLYDDVKKELMKFKMNTTTVDVYGKSVTSYNQGELFSTTDTDIDRQFALAEAKLCKEGIGTRYGNKYYDPNDPDAYKIDFILFTKDEGQMSLLTKWAGQEYHKMADAARMKVIKRNDGIIKRYNDIVSNGDKISEHSFQLPGTISAIHDADGRRYTNHLYVKGDTGDVWIKMNSWEEGVIEEETRRDDFVCWLRNMPRKPWALTIPYEEAGQDRAMYPDFIIIRSDGNGGYIVDVLEPHDPSRVDNLAKAKGFVRYAQKSQRIGRLQMIRQVSDATGVKFKRLDMTSSAVQPAVLHAATNDELNHIFDEMGFTE